MKVILQKFMHKETKSSEPIMTDRYKLIQYQRESADQWATVYWCIRDGS